MKKEETKGTAETMTQEEIEKHYTLKRFPAFWYGGGSSWKRSPYPKTDKRSLAYIHEAEKKK